MNSKRRDRINHSLLGDARAQAWSNLGLWQTGQTDYRTAAQALALQLAEQMRLQAASSLLDVACGYGASLNVWHEMGIRNITGLEPQTACVQAWQNDRRFQCWHDSMQSLNLLSQGQPFEAIIAIDAAYQWDVQLWLEQAHAALRPNGRLGFHFLLLADDFAQRPVWQRLCSRVLLRMVGVKTCLTAKQLQAALKTQTHPAWSEVGITDLSDEVLAGFGRYALRLPTYPLDFDHLKIQATGHLCRYLHRQKSVRYVSISLQKNGAPLNPHPTNSPVPVC